MRHRVSAEVGGWISDLSVCVIAWPDRVSVVWSKYHLVGVIRARAARPAFPKGYCLV
jgi:hypothetical protein